MFLFDGVLGSDRVRVGDGHRVTSVVTRRAARQAIGQWRRTGGRRAIRESRPERAAVGQLAGTSQIPETSQIAKASPVDIAIAPAGPAGGRRALVDGLEGAGRQHEKLVPFVGQQLRIESEKSVSSARESSSLPLTLSVRVNGKGNAKVAPAAIGPVTDSRVTSKPVLASKPLSGGESVPATH